MRQRARYSLDQLLAPTIGEALTRGVSAWLLLSILLQVGGIVLAVSQVLVLAGLVMYMFGWIVMSVVHRMVAARMYPGYSIFDFGDGIFVWFQLMTPGIVHAVRVLIWPGGSAEGRS